MPYIKNEEARQDLNQMIGLYKYLLKQPGYLNYFLFKLAKDTCKTYEDYRNFEGEIQQSLKEIFRRLCAPYEDDAIRRYGDIE